MSNPSALGALEFAPETAFAEVSSTFATHRIPVLDAIDPSGLIHSKEAAGRVNQHMQAGGGGYVLMGMEGSFTTKLDLTGHGTTTVGSPTVTAMETFLGYVFGNVSATIPASTTLAGGTAAVPTTVASGTFAAGSIARVGALGDLRGNGQMYAIGTHSTTTLNLLTALDGAPTAGDVLAGATNFYLHETGYGTGLNATTPGLRFRFISNNLHYAVYGCAPTGWTLSGLSPGERPQITVTWGCAAWEAVVATSPSVVATTTNNPNVVAAGSLFANTVGTATSAKRSHRALTIEISGGLQPLKGPGGLRPYQTIIAWQRMPLTVKWSWIENADATTATPVLQGWGTGTDYKHVMATLNAVAGKQVGFYSPNVCISSVPVQFNNNGINSLKFEGVAETGTTLTNDLTASALRMGWA